jgi:tRNA-dihydrouridine synthase
VRPSQRTKKVYWYQIGELYYRLFDNERCDRDSCLGCKKLDKCMIFRAPYERKKRGIQLERYEQGKEQAMAKERQELTKEQIMELLLPHVKDLLSERTGNLSVAKMKAWLRVEEGIKLSPWRTRIIRDQMQIQYKEILEALNGSEKAKRVFEVAVSSASENQNEGAQTSSEDTESS